MQSKAKRRPVGSYLIESIDIAAHEDVTARQKEESSHSTGIRSKVRHYQHNFLEPGRRYAGQDFV